MREKLLQLSDIGKSFGENRVLSGVSLDLFAGEVLVLAGENGAGKSTLIKIVAGLYRDFDGRVEVGGERVHLNGPADARRRGISVIHQELSLVESMSVADNICLGREPCTAAGLFAKRAAKAEMAEEPCHRMNLFLSKQDLDRPAGSFPLSVRYQIEIAKALAGEARILVMDEPTGALNQTEAEHLFGLIGGLRERGCGVIYISHRLEEIYRLADRITVLRDGRVVGSAPVEQCPRQTLIRWMIGRDLGELCPSHDPPSRCAQAVPRLRVSGFTVPSRGRGRPDVVRGLSLEVLPGEILGLFGLPGSGTSEFFNGLFGAYGPICTGEVEVGGKPFHPVSPAASVKRGLAYQTGDRKASGLVMGLSVAANITLASLPRVSALGVLLRKREQRRAVARVQALGLSTATVLQRAGHLSGGNQQKVVLAKWLETNPTVLLLEEPTRGVDVGAKKEIYETLLKLAAEGVAILLVSSDMEELLALCDRTLVLHRGSVTGAFARSESTSARLLEAAMGGQPAGSN